MQGVLQPLAVGIHRGYPEGPAVAAVGLAQGVPVVVAERVKTLVVVVMSPFHILVVGTLPAVGQAGHQAVD